MEKKFLTFIGLMSGTSLDGVDGVIVRFPECEGEVLQLQASAHQSFSPELKQQALALQQAGDNEIEREALLANALASVYADCVSKLLSAANCDSRQVQAIGVHGQTIRHRPDLGFTRQTNNPALLAELAGIDVIADFRSRDIAAGGHGAPLVPAFHRAMFGQAGRCRVVVNIGGISNISILHANGNTTGFDTGPGNVLMDAWIHQHQGLAYDDSGSWAAQGQVHTAFLDLLCREAYLQKVPPKSTGRDLFHLAWCEEKLAAFSDISAVDVQASLCAFTAKTIVDAIQVYAPDCEAVYVCGGGAYNISLMRMLKELLGSVHLDCTDSLGIAANHVEALAFAWLAQRFHLRLAGNLSDVTGAQGERILGALYPA
jgi:anhydro-N-acetylmuramic acid kinase